MWPDPRKYLWDALSAAERLDTFRNILIHGYAMVDDAIVWQVLTERLPELERILNALLASLDDRS